MVKKLNKRADDEVILSPFFFLMLAIVGIAIVTAVVVIMSSNSDIRVGEAKTLNDRLVYAIDDNGYLNDKIIKGGFDIFQDSDMNSQMFENTNDFYFNVQIYDENNQLKYSFVKGNKDFEIQCGLNGKKLAKCYSREIALLNPEESGQIFRVKIFSGVNSGDVK